MERFATIQCKGCRQTAARIMLELAGQDIRTGIRKDINTRSQMVLPVSKRIDIDKTLVCLEN